MMDETERPEDTIRRFAAMIAEMKEELAKYREAIELWQSAPLEKHDQVTDALIIFRVFNMESGNRQVAMGATDSVDWVLQLGMLHAALGIMREAGESDGSD